MFFGTTQGKPCPWCGRDPIARQSVYHLPSDHHVWSIGCPSAFTTDPTEQAACKMKPCTVGHPSLPEAKTVWNGREY